MKKKKVINDKKTVKINIAMSILLVVVLSFISVGYALYGQLLNINGTVTMNTQGKIAITDVTLVSSKNVTDDSIPAFTDDSIDFNLSFEKAPDSTEEDYQAVYSITIDNKTFYDYDFNLNNFQPIIRNSSGIEVDPSYLKYTLDGIELGDKISAGETKTFTLTLDFTPEDDDTYTVDGNMDTDLEEQPHGSLLGSITGEVEGDLRASLNMNLVEVNINVINSYQSPRTFTFNITDTSHFELVDANNNPLTNYTIDGGTTQQYTIYIKRAENAKFLTDSLTTNIILSSNDSNNNCGSIRILVDEEEEDDLTPPEISNIIVTTNAATSETTTDNKVGSITLNWTGIDNESGVEKYYIIAYTGASGSETVYNTYETENSNPEFTITGLEDANYSFKIYGSNNQQHAPSQSEIDSCNNNYCSKTTNTSYKWHFTVTLTNDSTNVKSISPTAVNRGKTLNATITANEGESGGGCGGGNTSYSLSNSVTVKMGGSEITSGTTSGHYRYTLSNDKTTATLIVYDVTGDITVKATATTN